MRDLIKQEQFEIEVLDKLNSGKLTAPLLFTGGTMLRLCYGLNRFSIDLDFWSIKKIDFNDYFKRCNELLSRDYIIKDAANKHFTILFEITSVNYPNKLKIEIRKEIKKISYDESIAYSRYSDKQVLLKTVRLEDFMNFKIDAFLDRKEIRDCFDMEFLYKRGIGLNADNKKLRSLLRGIEALNPRDYSVKLSSILEEKDRKYYRESNFKILKMAIEVKLG